ncbi:MAG: hypothetical protein ACRDYC_10155 [Acidimicrobiales bacterium]
MSALYGAGACLIIAQIIGIYGLVTRKADLVFSVWMAGLVVLALGLAGYGAYSTLAA